MMCGVRCAHHASSTAHSPECSVARSLLRCIPVIASQRVCSTVGFTTQFRESGAGRGVSRRISRNVLRSVCSRYVLRLIPGNASVGRPECLISRRISRNVAPESPFCSAFPGMWCRGLTWRRISRNAAEKRTAVHHSGTHSRDYVAWWNALRGAIPGMRHCINRYRPTATYPHLLCLTRE